MKVLYLFNFIILILSGSCTPKEAIIEANKKFVIDINQQDKITIFFNAYHTIALETTPNNLIGGIDKIVLQNEHIYILDKKQATIFIFTHNGKYQNKIANQGRAPGEYLSISDFEVYDSHVYCLSRTNQKIFKYDTNGVFQNTIQVNDWYDCFHIQNDSSDTKEMIGIQSVPVIADAILKGVPGFDYEKAFEAMKSSMLSNYKGLEYLKEGNYIPADREKESVAKGLEYAIADWGVAQVAKKLGKEEDYRWFKARSENYREYWDKKTHFFRGKNVDGTWSQPFSPFRSAHRNDDYCEGNGWQYTWLVPHDVEGLVNLFGSEKAFSLKLDSLFIVEGDMGAEASGDISGLIGQYAHGNEPGHHTVYLYAFVGEQWKTAEKVRNILKTMYRNEPNGLEGNEDC